MKILFLISKIGYGGAEKMQVWVANQCVKAGHDVAFLTYRDHQDMQCLDKKIKRLYLDVIDVPGGKNITKTITHIRKVIKQEKFDLGVAFLFPAQLRLFFAALGTGMKLLFSERGDPYQLNHTTGIKHKLICGFQKWIFSQSDGYVFQTEMAKKYYSKLIQNKSIVIPNPITPMIRTQKRIIGGNKHIVCVARLDIKQKRQDLLIKAFKLLTDKYTEYILDFYGDGEDELTLKKMALSCSRIQFMGKTHNVCDAIQNASISVLTSDFEGIPNTLLESMSLGIPCISTRCSPGGAELLIENNVNGLLVPRGDIEKLAQAIEYIITHPLKAEEMAMKATQVNDRFSQDKISQKWIEYISSLKS